ECPTPSGSRQLHPLPVFSDFFFDNRHQGGTIPPSEAGGSGKVRQSQRREPACRMLGRRLSSFADLPGPDAGRQAAHDPIPRASPIVPDQRRLLVLLRMSPAAPASEAGGRAPPTPTPLPLGRERGGGQGVHRIRGRFAARRSARST